MNKNFIKKLIAAAAVIAMWFSLFSCETTGNTAKSSSTGDFDYSKLTGSWFWDYGFDQKKFGNEELILNKDGTCSMFSIGPDWSEYDEGKYSVINDEKHGASLVVNLLKAKEKAGDEWQSVDVKLYYALEKITDEEIIMHRYKRDFSAMNNGIEYSEPAIYQHYMRIKDGSAAKFIGTWKMNSALFPGLPFEVKWTVNENGSLKNEKVSKDETVVREGVWDVSEGKNGSILHVKYSTINGDSYSEEYWYEYFNIGSNLNKLIVFKQNINGKEEMIDAKEEMFYYRDIPLLTYTYNLNSATKGFSFKDFNPSNEAYELVQTNRRYLFEQASNVADRIVVDWYDNPEFNGSPVTEISASGNTKDREFWGKWGFKFHRNEWNPQDINYGHNYAVDYNVQLLFPNMNVPASGDTVKIALSATVDKNLKGLTFEIIDYSEGWKAIGSKYLKVTPVDGKISLYAEIPIKTNPKEQTLDNLGFNMYYMHDELEDTCSFRDVKIQLIDENESANIIEYTLNYCNQSFKVKSFANFNFALPFEVRELEGLREQMQAFSVLEGWYDNPEFNGNPVRVISGENNTKARNFYGKFSLKNDWYEKRDDGTFYNNIQIPVTSVIQDARINPKKGDVLKVAVTANVSKDYEGQMGLDLSAYNRTDGFIGNDWHYVKTKNKKLQTCFEIKMYNDANFASMDEAGFLFAYNPVSEKDLLVLSDVKFDLVDEDPFITESDENRHVKVEPCAEGLKFTVAKLPSDKLKLNDSFNIYINGNKYNLGASVDQKAVEEKGTVTFVWPFCEKGKVYSFVCTWFDGNGKWNSETLKVRAKNGKGELNMKALDKVQISLESNSKEADVCARNLTKESILNVAKDYVNELFYLRIQIPFIAGKNDWSDTEWLFGHASNIYPEFDGNTFYTDLMNKGKANIFGDHDFWFGDKKQFMNEEFTKYKTFWTRLSLYFKIKSNPDYVEFYTESHVTENVPYTPVKF